MDQADQEFEKKGNGIMQETRQSLKILDKYGYKPNVIPVAYSWDHKFNCFRELTRPPMSMFAQVGYDDPNEIEKIMGKKGGTQESD